LGGGALFFYLEPQKAIINDINSKLMAFYTGVRDNFQILKNELTEIERIYTDNRRRFEELKSITPDKRVDDDNEPLYYKIKRYVQRLN